MDCGFALRRCVFTFILSGSMCIYGGNINRGCLAAVMVPSRSFTLLPELLIASHWVDVPPLPYSTSLTLPRRTSLLLPNTKIRTWR